MGLIVNNFGNFWRRVISLAILSEEINFIITVNYRRLRRKIPKFHNTNDSKGINNTL